MILTINIGNSNITVGGFENGECLMTAQIYASQHCSADEYAIKLDSLFHTYHMEEKQVDGAILSSVVPLLTGRLCDALRKLYHVRVLVVGPGLKSGIPIHIDNPSELGGELLCCAVAGKQLAQPPFVVINMDTALSMMAVDRKGVLCGGVILPGPHVSLNSLVQGTAQLPQVNFRRKPVGVIATNTADCLQSGVILGTAAMMDGLMDRFRTELGEDTSFIATGNLPETIRAACRNDMMYQEGLILKGLYLIWMKNSK